jgi:hypothetical protein
MSVKKWEYYSRKYIDYYEGVRTSRFYKKPMQDGKGNVKIIIGLMIDHYWILIK